MKTDDELREIVEQCWRVAESAHLEAEGSPMVNGDWKTGTVQVHPMRANVFYYLLSAQLPRHSLDVGPLPVFG